jgi:hypothetical protein
MYGFFLMMLYAGLMGKDGLKEYPIGNPALLWEEYLIIVGIVYMITIFRYWRKSLLADKNGRESHEIP